MQILKVTSLLRTFYVLHMDHGGEIYQPLQERLCQWKSGYVRFFGCCYVWPYGPLHGRANPNCLAFVREVGKSVMKVRQVLRNLLDNGGKVAGFGHAVLRAESKPPFNVLSARICQTILCLK